MFTFPSVYFNAKDTLECGQTFRFEPFENGFFVTAWDKACYIFTCGATTTIECPDEENDYWKNYFDLETDYSKIVERAKGYDVEFLTLSAESGKGVRILKQREEEMIISFIVSQNNNIPRIKKILNAICQNLGEKKSFLGREYYTFPTMEKLAGADESFFSSIGAGYRAKYLVFAARKLRDEGVERLKELDTAALKTELLKFLGIGEKVANCIILFGFSRPAFPVDTWIEKLYRENFGGTLTDRGAITRFFEDKFGADSGYIQQYLFYYKRSKEN